MRLGLSVYGTMYSMGINRISDRSRIRPLEFIDKAISLGLEGVEIPVELLENEDEIAVAQYARDHGMFLSLETSGIHPGHLSKALELAARMEAPTLRTIVMGAKLGGDRRPMLGRWKAYLEEIHKSLKEAAETAENVGVNLAVENHQDIASEELLELCESINSEKFGIVFDTGSTLATAEDPLEFAAKAANYIKHVHLKDYELYLSEEGYRLVRCAFGQGAIDFPGIFDIFSRHCSDVTMTIEVGALEARHVRLLADDYWTEYPPRSAAQFAKVMRFVLKNAKTSDDWRTPYELGASSEAIIAYEQQQLEESIVYLKQILNK